MWLEQERLTTPHTITNTISNTPTITISEASMSRVPSHIVLTPAVQKRLTREQKKASKSGPENHDLKSIRERRERLEAMIQSRRLPPLAPAGANRGSSSSRSSQRSSRMSLSPHWKESDQQARAERQPTPKPNRSSVRLTPMPSRGGGHDPLPEIKQEQRDEDEEDSRPPTGQFLQEIHQQMTLEMQQLMQQQMQKMQQLLQQKKEQQLRKKQRQEQLEQQLMQQRAQEAQAEENKKRAAQEEVNLSTTENTSPDAGSSADQNHQHSNHPANKDTTDVEATNAGDEGEEDISGEVAYIVEGVSSSEARRQLRCAERARVLLSSSRPPITQLIQAGLLKPLVHCMTKTERPELQQEASWAVTNIASGTSQHTRAVVEAGAVAVLVRLLSSPNMGVKEQAVWALGNIVGDGAECRDAALRAGIVRPLTNLIHLTMPVSLRRQVCWVITNLFRFKEPHISPEERRQCALALKELVASIDTQVQADALWGTAHFADMGAEAVDELVEVGLVSDMVQRLYSDYERVITSALRATGSVAAGTNLQTDAVVQAGALPIYRELLTHTNPGIAREAAWILSNITAGTTNHIQLVIDVQVVPALIAAVDQKDVELRKEATWALANLTCGCTTEQVAVLVSFGVVACLCTVMADQHNTGLVLVALDALSNVFKKTEDEESIVRVTEACGGLDTLRQLEASQEAQVSRMATYLTTTYFQAGSGQEDQGLG
ncbi:uncharacterized protein [Panulirus ornatus]|uniref:uncharacterized protein isoform X2 n=1 Tax=Panulirus ornatus TaxID=150431 RepID=UPI003A87B6F3